MTTTAEATAWRALRQIARGAETRMGLAPGALLAAGPNDDAGPFVEFRGGQWHYVARERGSELFRHIARDGDELLYWAARDIAFWRAVAHERRHRDHTRDPRRLIFAEQRRLLARAGPDWAARLDAEHAATLARHPFMDPSPGPR